MQRRATAHVPRRVQSRRGAQAALPPPSPHTAHEAGGHAATHCSTGVQCTAPPHGRRRLPSPARPRPPHHPPVSTASSASGVTSTPLQAPAPGGLGSRTARHHCTHERSAAQPAPWPALNQPARPSTPPVRRAAPPPPAASPALPVSRPLPPRTHARTATPMAHAPRRAPVVHLHVVLPVHVQRVRLVGKEAAGERVARVAGVVVGHHHYNVRVGYSQAPDGVVDGHGVADVAVVEPVARGAHDDGPVAGVA